MPEKKKTTMSVTEMRKLLGLGKTDSYWLVHKNCFETIMVNGKMRIVIDSFEKWYANQIKHVKVDGPPPGEELRAYSYSVRDIAQMLSIDESSVYYLIKRDQIPSFKVETWTRIRKKDFDKWYASQNKHRTPEDREKDAQMEAETLTMPEMARELYITRKDVYNILAKKENQDIFEIVVIADKKRITRESFERWYAGQSKYRKLSDRTPEELYEIRMAEKKKETPRLEVNPIIGTMKLSDVTPRVLEKYYMTLLQTKAVVRCTDKQYAKRETPGKRDSFVTPGTVRRVHKLLNSAFTQAMKWELIEKNPAQLATVPKAEKKTRAIWDADTLFHAIEVCEDERLKLAINLAFSCSLRVGELLGLTWDCVDLSEGSLAEGKASIFINKELQRVRKSTMATLEKKDVLCVFPEHSSGTATVLVLKKPKTLTSTRRVYLPRTVAEMLIDWKKGQELAMEELGDEYHDYQLVMAGPFGFPMEHGRINELFNQLIREHNLPKVVFHILDIPV